ncbi:MAG: BMC domain-containing protein [Candidatus Eisenbacteria bacterium]
MDVSPPEFREVRPREALAVLELPEIHPGLFVLDAMVKEAPIEVLSATPIPPGRFLIVVSGSVGEVEAAYHRGATLAERVAGSVAGYAGGNLTVHDRLFLAEVAPAVLAALRPDRKERDIDALGIFETASVASCLDAADRLAKGADVRLEQLHLARGIAGRSFGVVTGRQDMVAAALELAEERGEHHARWIGSSLIARPDPSIARRVLGDPWGFFEGQEIL